MVPRPIQFFRILFHKKTVLKYNNFSKKSTMQYIRYICQSKDIT